jgi:hypothetical protein
MPAFLNKIDERATGLAVLDVDRLSYADHAALMRVCGQAAGLSASTIERYDYAYRRYLGFLKAERDRVLERPPAERFDRMTLEAYAGLLQADTGRDVALATFKQLSQCLRVAVPDAPRDAIKAVMKRLKSAPAERHRRGHHRLAAIKTLPAGDLVLIERLSRRKIGIGWTQATRDNAIGDYRRFLGVVGRHDPRLLALAPEQRITPATIRAYAQAIEAVYGATAALHRLRALKLAIKNVVGGEHLGPIAQVVKAYREMANGGPSSRDLMPSLQDKEAMCSSIEIATLGALEDEDIIDERGAMREATARSFRYCYLEFIACVARHDRDLLMPDVRQRDLTAMLRLYLVEKKPLWKASTLSTALTSILRVLARILPPEDLAVVRDEVRAHHATAATDFWQRTVDVAELQALGLRICRQARARLCELSEVEFPYRSLRSLAERYRNGLMILTLGLSALRVGNFSALAEGSTFVDKGARYRITFEGEDVKNRVDIRITLAQAVRPWFDDYLGWIRPLIVEGEECKALWPSYSGKHRAVPERSRPGRKVKVHYTDRRGKPLGVSQIQRIVSGIVEDELGYELTCHDFRRSAASFAAIDGVTPSDAPGSVLIDHTQAIIDGRYKSPLAVHADTLNGLAAAADNLPWNDRHVIGPR